MKKSKSFKLPLNIVESLKESISYELYKNLLLTYGKRGEKAYWYLKEDRIKKYRDFFIAVGEEEYIVEEEFCTCRDFNINLKGKAPCSHIIAVEIAKLTGNYKEYDSFYVDFMDPRLKSRLSGSRRFSRSRKGLKKKKG